MSVRKILVPVFGTVHDQAALQAALGFAKQFGAHVQALLVRADPATALPYGYMGSEVSGYAGQYAIEAAIKASDEAQKAAQSTFDKIVEKFGIAIEAKPGSRADASAQFTVVQGDFAEAVERKSRVCDLIVFGTRLDEEKPPQLRQGIESVLLSGTRPVVVAPRETTQIIGRRIAIAYDGSATAAHALTAAVPFLTRAQELHAFEVTAGKPSALEELDEYLALRGLRATGHIVEPGKNTIGEALLTAVSAENCDLLVLGGYGHSRVREFVLGGVTRHVLSKGAPCAVLMAH